MKNVLEAADAVCSSARSMNPGVPIGQTDAVVSGEKILALHSAVRDSVAGDVVSESGETVACEPGGEPPPPPPARTNAEKFWAALMPQQAFDLLKAAPKVAGPWTASDARGGGAVLKSRRAPNGSIVAAEETGLFVISSPGTTCADPFRDTAAEADAALRELGWILVD